MFFNTGVGNFEWSTYSFDYLLINAIGEKYIKYIKIHPSLSNKNDPILWGTLAFLKPKQDEKIPGLRILMKTQSKLSQ